MRQPTALDLVRGFIPMMFWSKFHVLDDTSVHPCAVHVSVRVVSPRTQGHRPRGSFRSGLFFSFLQTRPGLANPNICVGSAYKTKGAPITKLQQARRQASGRRHQEERPPLWPWIHYSWPQGLTQKHEPTRCVSSAVILLRRRVRADSMPTLLATRGL